MKKSNPMRKIYNSSVFWLVVSLLASLTIWVYVTNQDTEEWKQTFPGVQVELINEDVLRNSKNMVITDLDVATVTLELTGPRRVIASMSPEDLKAQIDVSKLSQAAYTSQTYNVKFPDGIDLSNVTVNRKTPDTISFMVSAQTTKQIQVRGSFEGEIAEGCSAEAPIFEPSTITVTGPEAYLKDISYAWVSFGTDVTASTSYEVQTGFALMDAEGNECRTTGIMLSDETVSAQLTILEVKDVQLTVDLIEGAGATSANTLVKIEPEFVTLAGDSAILSGINKIVLKTIDLTDFKGTYTDTFPILIDNELRNLSGETEAKVTVEIVGLEARTFNITNFTCTNVTNGFVADILTQSLNVVLRGTSEDLALLENENLRAVADLTDYNESTGQYLVDVKIYVDGFTNVGAIGDYTINVEIRKA